MRASLLPAIAILSTIAICQRESEWVRGAAAGPVSAEKKLNNLVANLLEVSPGPSSSEPLVFSRPRDGWLFISVASHTKEPVRVILDKETRPDVVIVHDSSNGPRREAFRYVIKGRHTITVQGGSGLDSLVIRAVPELMHCGLGFNSQIKAYGIYDMDFLKKDILPNITTLIVPNNIQLDPTTLTGWRAQGKRFIAEVGINGQASTAEEHYKFWAGFYDKAPFLDGILINEFIVNNPTTAPGTEPTPETLKKREREQLRHEVFIEAIKKLRSDDRYKNKEFYAYVGGSGKKLNQEMIGTNFVRTILDSGSHIALERYLHEMSSEKGSKDALQLFVDGISDWEAKEPGVKQQMIVAFGLFSMPPGGINKQPNVDYHVWMDQQVNLVANHPALANIGGLEWWTSILADEETVRFVGKLYRHYAIEGNTQMFTKDPLFLPHLQNADFEKGTDGWILHAAEDGSIAAKSFPRYGRIEGRFMGLGRPADPEHIGDTFLWMKRSEKAPNTFAQTIRSLEPGRLYSMKMFSCDYNDLMNPMAKKLEEANKFIGNVVLEGVELDEKRSFSELYPSSPEPKIPVWITYFWKVFRAKSTTAKVIVSDWPSTPQPGATFGHEQTFNFLELQPYWE